MSGSYKNAAAWRRACSDPSLANPIILSTCLRMALALVLVGLLPVLLLSRSLQKPA